MIDITGQKINRLTAIKFIERRGLTYYWLFKCDCGKEKVLPKGDVMSGHTKSCGCLNLELLRARKNRFKDITGQKNGFLTAIKFIERKNKKTYYLFKCDCGVEKIINKADVLCGKISPCGHRAGQGKVTHHMTGTRFYKIWKGIKDRCLNKKSDAYNDYGGRGIKICDRWANSFENFKKDLYENYLLHEKENGTKNTMIERIDNNGNYEPENIKWATRSEQNNNTRQNRRLLFNGSNKTITEWSKIKKIGRLTLSRRLGLGWTTEEALTVPVIKNQKYKKHDIAKNITTK